MTITDKLLMGGRKEKLKAEEALSILTYKSPDISGGNRLIDLPLEIHKGSLAASKYTPDGGDIYGVSVGNGKVYCTTDNGTSKYLYNLTDDWRIQVTPQNKIEASKCFADSVGNVYYGFTDDDGTNDYAVIIKYNSSGVEQWKQKYYVSGNDITLTDLCNSVFADTTKIGAVFRDNSDTFGFYGDIAASDGAFSAGVRFNSSINVTMCADSDSSYHYLAGGHKTNSTNAVIGRLTNGTGTLSGSRFPNIDSEFTRIHDIVVDGTDVYIVGLGQSSTSSNYFLQKLPSALNTTTWTVEFRGGEALTNIDNATASIAVGSNSVCVNLSAEDSNLVTIYSVAKSDGAIESYGSTYYPNTGARNKGGTFYDSGNFYIAVGPDLWVISESNLSASKTSILSGFGVNESNASTAANTSLSMAGAGASLNNVSYTGTTTLTTSMGITLDSVAPKSSEHAKLVTKALTAVSTLVTYDTKRHERLNMPNVFNTTDGNNVVAYDSYIYLGENGDDGSPIAIIGTLSGVGANLNSLHRMCIYKDKEDFFEIATGVDHTTASNTDVVLSNISQISWVCVASEDVSESQFMEWTTKDLAAGESFFYNGASLLGTSAHFEILNSNTVRIKTTAPTGKYTIYAFNHDESIDGVVRSGVVTVPADNIFQIDLGWEPQQFIGRSVDSSNICMSPDRYFGLTYRPGNTTFNDNSDFSKVKTLSVYKNGLEDDGVNSGTSFIIPNEDLHYIAFRREDGPNLINTELMYTAGDSGISNVHDVPFAADLHLSVINNEIDFILRKTSNDLEYLRTHDTNDLKSFGNQITEYFTSIDSANCQNQIWSDTTIFLCGFLMKEGFLDAGVFEGAVDPHTATHYLNDTPDLILTKSLTKNDFWAFWCSELTSTSHQLELNDNSGEANTGYYGALSSSVINYANTTLESNNHYMYIVMKKVPGILDIGSYVGDNTNNRVINCGFSSSARLIVIKRINGNGNWRMYSDVLGIVAGDDTYKDINLNVGTNTADDVDINSSGFEVNSGMNATGVTYIYIAIA